MAAQADTLRIESATPADARESSTGKRLRRCWPGAVCCGLYIVLAMLQYGHFSSLGPGHMTGHISADAIQQVWWLAWTAFAIPHGHNVFLAQWQNYPAGQNFAANSSMLAIGVPLMPITKLFGPVVTWNIALRLAVALSASSMCFVLRRWTKWWPAAFFGGLLYGFSAYMAYYGSDYLFLVFVPLPPVIFLLLHETLVRQQWRPKRTGALLGAVCALQFFISTEVLASSVVMCAIAVVLFLLVSRHQLAERWRYAAVAFAYSLAVGGLLLVLPVVFALAGPQNIKGPLGHNVLFSSDLLGSIVPSSQWFSTTQLTAIADRFGSSSELYLGVPLVVVLASFAVFLHKRRTILFAGTLALIAFVLSLGPRLTVDGRETSIPLPSVVFEHLPLVKDFDPVRFSLYTALFAAGMFAIGLDELWQRMMRSSRPAWSSPRWRNVATVGLLAAITAVAVLPLAPRHTQPATRTNVPSLFTSAAVGAIPVGSVVLAYPYPDFSGGLYFLPPHDIMLDQAVAGMPFKLIGGYGWFPSATGTEGTISPTVLKPESVQAIFDAAFHGNATRQTAPLSKRNVTALRVFLRKYDVQTVMIVSRSGLYPAAVISYVTAAIGSPVESGGVTAWFHVKERLRVDQAHIAPTANGGGETFLKLVTDVFIPAKGATLSGSAPLFAFPSSYFAVTKVEFYLTGGSQHDALIGIGRPTPLGWATRWNTTTVANGTYTLQSVAHNAGGMSATSAPVSITVSN